MNVIGKILVVLNLVFALVVAGFLVIDFAARTSWRTAHDKLKNEMQVAEANYKASINTMNLLNNENRRLKDENKKLKESQEDNDKTKNASESNFNIKLQEEKDRADEFKINYEKALAEKERLKEEVKSLLATIAGREQTIAAMQKEATRLRTEAIANENVAKAMQSRNEGLLEQNQALLRELARARAGTSSDAVVARDPNAPNPPSVNVKGTIERVDAKGNETLVEISLGTDQGINKNHTLEVFRLSPRPEYLGMIRILEAKHRSSVGRLIPSVGGRKILQQGDSVASNLSVK